MISSTGRNESGFSLLELMVVVFIIGLLSGVAALTLPSKDGGALLQEQRFKLIGSLRSARAEAVFSGHSLGLQWQRQRGSFYVLTADGWQKIVQGVLAKNIVLADDVQTELLVDGEVIHEKTRLDNEEAEQEVNPQLLFLSDGQISPFEWRLSTAGAESLSFDEQLTVDRP
ncbi:type II secretion system minor pseudopilin GspH [Zhongshania sp.]|uniref:type II secretion system minor pseudopilin GspH n=1 Tax=Zhongshania sp. TaxID=1971902 RepID=UPI002A81B7B1|nr:type II secretion system minor pseudopilin GspH [Zhongshania sp.]